MVDDAVKAGVSRLGHISGLGRSDPKDGTDSVSLFGPNGVGPDPKFGQIQVPFLGPNLVPKTGPHNKGPIENLIGNHLEVPFFGTKFGSKSGTQISPFFGSGRAL